VGYDALLADWRGQVGRIEAAHGAALPHMTDEGARQIDAFLSPELRHNAAAAGLADLGWAGELTQRVLDWFEAAASEAAPGPEALEQAAGDLARRERDMGALVSPSARDLDVARAELLDLRQRIEFARGEARRLEAEVEALRREAADAAFHLDAILADG
jgi:hypothetical protein